MTLLDRFPIASNLKVKRNIIRRKTCTVFITGMSDADDEILEDELQLTDKKILDSWNVYRSSFFICTSLLCYLVLTKSVVLLLSN